MANRQLRRSWDDFQYFLAVARIGTLAAAATQLATEHTTIARHIRTLEDQLSARLFHRSNTGYSCMFWHSSSAHCAAGGAWHHGLEEMLSEAIG